MDFFGILTATTPEVAARTPSFNLAQCLAPVFHVRGDMLVGYTTPLLYVDPKERYISSKKQGCKRNGRVSTNENPSQKVHMSDLPSLIFRRFAVRSVVTYCLLLFT